MVNRLITRVFVIIIFVALLQFLSTILLARFLTKPEMGLYRLAISIVELGAFISVLGVDYSLVRFFSSPGESFGSYTWKSVFRLYGWPMAGLIVLVTAIAQAVYRFDARSAAFVFILLVCVSSQNIFSALLRAYKKYTLAIFSARAYFAVFFLLLTVLAMLGRVVLGNVLLGYAAACATCAACLAAYCLKKIPGGSKPIPRSVFKNGFYYFGLGVSHMFILQAGYLVIGKILTLRDLGIYTVVASIMRLFEFVQDAFYYVLAPHLNTEEDLPVRRILITLGVTTLLTAVFYFAAGKILLHVFFRGLYDEGNYLIPLFTCVGIIRNTYIIPASILGGRSSEKILRNQLFFMVVVAIASFYLTYVCVQTWHLAGVVIAAGFTWLVVSAVSWTWATRYLTHAPVYNHTEQERRN